MERGLNRRRFLAAAIGTGAAAAGAGSLAPAASGAATAGLDASSGVPGDRRGIQLYSLRRIMDNSQDDARKVLRWLGTNGYTTVEPYWRFDWTPQQFRAELDRAGLRVPTSHDGLDIDSANWKQSYRQNLEYAAEVGQQYTGLAWYPPPYTEERFRRIADRMNEAGALANKYGLKFFYHNHDFEFLNRRANGNPLYDVYIEETEPDLVMFELDILWITVGGESAVHYLAEHGDRYMGYHVKDRVWGTRRLPDGTPDNPVEDVGPGMLDFPDVFRAGDRRGVDKHFIIEHDWPQLSHPGDEDAEYKTAKAGIDYLGIVRW